MTTVHGPVGSRRRLRTALRQAREAAGFTQEDVAGATDWSPSKVIRIENGTVNISVTDLKALLDLYRITEPVTVAELVDLARTSRRRAWWTAYKESVPAAYLSFIGLEAEASALRCCQPVSLPGIMQTRDYAMRYMRRMVSEELPAGTLDDRVAIRMRRQRELLSKSNPPQISAVLDEGVLHRTYGSAEVLRDQLLHLIDLGARPGVSIRVLPFHADITMALSPFVILEFPDPTDTDVVYLESVVDRVVIDRDQEEVLKYRRAYQRLEEASLSHADSLDLIGRVAGGLS